MDNKSIFDMIWLLIRLAVRFNKMATQVIIW